MDADVRKIVADHIMDESNSPMSCLGGLIQAMRSTGTEQERMLADIVNAVVLATAAPETEETKRPDLEDGGPGPFYDVVKGG